MTSNAAGESAVRLALVAMGELTGATTAMAIDRFGRGQFAVVDLPDAQAAIVDADRMADPEALDAFCREHPEKSVILLSWKPVEVAQTVTLLKPVGVGQLLEALEQIRTDVLGGSRHTSTMDRPAEGPSVEPATADHGVEAASNETAPRQGSSPLSDPGAKRVFGLGMAASTYPAEKAPTEKRAGSQPNGGVHFDFDQGAIGSLQRAANHAAASGRVVALSGLPGPLYIDTSTPQTAITQLRAEDLRAACQTDANELRHFTMAAIPQSAADYPRIPMEAVLWSAALWTSRGRLPKQIDPYAPLELVAWPNFTRLPMPAHGLRIAALWAGRPAAAGAIAERLSISQADVFAFCSGALALGLLRQVSEEQSNDSAPRPQAEQAPAPVVNRGLLSRLIGRLFHAH